MTTRLGTAAASDRRRSRVPVTWCALVLLGGTAAVATEPAVSRPSRVDHAVVPAGGPHCRHCAAACPLHHAHLAECRDGLCAPHCPVRPSQYGYYRTQWRRWPGQGVVPAGAEEAFTPAPPPRSQVPTADEESPRSPTDDAESAEADDGASGRTPNPVRPARPGDTGGALPTNPLPENPASEEAGRTKPDAAEGVPPVPPGDDPLPPRADGQDGNDRTGGLLDQSAVAPDDAAPHAAAGAMRYPADVGRSLVAGSMPWRLQPAAHQRPAGSGRGL